MTLIIFHLFHSFFILLHKEGEEEAIGVAISDSECSLIGGAFANGNLADYKQLGRGYVRTCARERGSRVIDRPRNAACAFGASQLARVHSSQLKMPSNMNLIMRMIGIAYDCW